MGSLGSGEVEGIGEVIGKLERKVQACICCNARAAERENFHVITTSDR